MAYTTSTYEFPSTGQSWINVQGVGLKEQNMPPLFLSFSFYLPLIFLKQETALEA